MSLQACVSFCSALCTFFAIFCYFFCFFLQFSICSLQSLPTIGSQLWWIPGFSGLPVLYLYFFPWICFEIKYDWLIDWNSTRCRLLLFFFFFLFFLFCSSPIASDGGSGWRTTSIFDWLSACPLLLVDCSFWVILNYPCLQVESTQDERMRNKI